MASDKSTSKGEFDERLEEALNSALLEGEKVLAREEADQGQAVVLTDSRIILIKAGLTATGELHGQKIKVYPLDTVTAINVRKGPLGAVIQVISTIPSEPAQSGPPDNVIIFTGSQRIKKCEMIAAKIESALGKSVNKTEPDPQHDDPQPQVAVEEPVQVVDENPDPEPPKGGREPRSLAEEIFSEIAQAPPQPVQAAHPAPEPVVSEPEPEPVPEIIPDPVPAAPEIIETVGVAPVAGPMSSSELSSLVTEQVVEEEQIIEEHVAEEHVVEEPVAEEPESAEQFRPNPRLPKPMHRKQNGPNKVLVLLGVLAGLLLFSVAVIAPIRQAQLAPKVHVDAKDNATNDLKGLQIQMSAVSAYRSQVISELSKADAEAAKFHAALESGSKASILAAGQPVECDKAWGNLSDLDAPPGLAGAKESLTAGLLARKNAITMALSAAQSSDPLDVKEISSRLSQAELQIKKGLAGIDAANSELEKQTSHEPVKYK